MPVRLRSQTELHDTKQRLDQQLSRPAPTAAPRTMKAGPSFASLVHDAPGTGAFGGFPTNEGTLQPMTARDQRVAAAPLDPFADSYGRGDDGNNDGDGGSEGGGYDGHGGGRGGRGGQGAVGDDLPPSRFRTTKSR